jgi:pimeloyl-ACP methyl ester carboxylesterase
MAQPSGLQTGYAPSGGARIHFEWAGSGAPLVFLHAGASDSRMWAPKFEALQKSGCSR